MRLFPIAAGTALALCAAAWTPALQAATPGASSAQSTSDEAGAVPAVWTPKQLRFTYMGFTSRYSCDGLRERVTRALRELGARSDMQVRELPCAASLGRPARFPGVTLKIDVLEPATGHENNDVVAVPAHWQAVDLTLDRNAVRAAGECELMEQIKQQILPLFTTRNVRYRSSCVPHQLTVGGTSLQAEVLVPDRPEHEKVRARS